MTPNTDIINWIALNSVHGLGPVRIQKLLEVCGTPEAIFEANQGLLRRVAGVGDETVVMLKDPAVVERAEAEVRETLERGFHIVTLDDPNYPDTLREIFAPPPVLYVRGQVEALKKTSVAVVGTRKPTQYGRNATPAIVSEFPIHGIAVVSGLALGIDAIAHQTTLDSAGVTIAVLASGVDNPTPLTNRKIAERIPDNGAIISEFPLGTPAEPYHFPRRNRIISGLSAGTVVIEAGRKSGTLITANYALQQGRDVFAVPGSIFSEKSEGCNNLIRQGAIPIQTGSDVVEAIRSVSLRPSVGEPAAVVQASEELLNDQERSVLTSIGDESLRMDQLAERTGKNMGILFDVLLNLELKGHVRQVAGQQYMRATVARSMYGG